MSWTLKLDETTGSPVLLDGRPVYRDEAAGSEVAFDVQQLHDKILTLNKECKTHRTAAEAASARLSALSAKFEGIEDLDAWIEEATKAVDTVKALDSDALLDANKVARLKTEMTEAFTVKESKAKQKHEAAVGELTGVVSRKDAQLRALLVSNRFATCPLFSGSDPVTLLPADIAEAKFGQHFKVEEKDGALQLVAYDQNRDVIMSRERPGEPADFDEAIKVMFDRYPDKDRLLRTTSGGGTDSGGGTNRGQKVDEMSMLNTQLGKAVSMRDRIALKRRISALQQVPKK